MQYDLQVNDWIDWEVVEKFNDQTDAKSYARETYAQNEWRIYDNVNQRVIHHHDPSQVFSEIAMADLDRFRRVDNWTRRREDRQQQQQRRREINQNRVARLRMLHRNSPRNGVRDDMVFCFEEKTDKVNWIKEGF